MVKRIIFDVDNTLIPWKDEYNQAIVLAYKDYKINITEEELNDFVDVLHNYESTHSTYNKELMTNYFNKNYTHGMPVDYIEHWLKYLTKMTPIKDDELKNTLEYLSSKYSLAVLTNWYAEGQKARLNNIDVDKYFDDFYGGENFMKPAEEAFLTAKGEYEVEECLMVGDSDKFDLIIPQKLGMQTYKVENSNDVYKLKEML